MEKKITLVLSEHEIEAIKRCISFQQEFACIASGKAAKSGDMEEALAYAKDASLLGDLNDKLPTLI